MIVDAAMARIMQAVRGKSKVNEADRAQAIVDYENERGRLESERTQLLGNFQARVQSGAKVAQYEVDQLQRRLDANKARQARIAANLKLLQNVDRAVSEQREQAALLRIMAGSTRELKEAEEEMRKDPDLDLDAVASEFDDVMSSTVARTGDISTAFSSRNAFAELDASAVDEARFTDEAEFVASASSGQEIASILQAAKQQRVAEADLLNLELKSALPNVAAAPPSPSIVGSRQATTTPVVAQDLDWLLDRK